MLSIVRCASTGRTIPDHRACPAFDESTAAGPSGVSASARKPLLASQYARWKRSASAAASRRSCAARSGAPSRSKSPASSVFARYT